MTVLLGGIGANNIKIDKLNYLGDFPNDDYNSKVLYYRNNKLHYATVYVDFFHKRITFPKQPKEGKVYKGLQEELHKFIFKK